MGEIMTKSIFIRCTPDDKAALVAAARAERRSLSSFMVAAGMVQASYITDNIKRQDVARHRFVMANRLIGNRPAGKR